MNDKTTQGTIEIKWTANWISRLKCLFTGKVKARFPVSKLIDALKKEVKE